MQNQAMTRIQSEIDLVSPAHKAIVMKVSSKTLSLIKFQIEEYL